MGQRWEEVEEAIMMLDVAASTELAELLGDLDTRVKIMDPFFYTVNKITTNNGGDFIKSYGDDYLATFPTCEQAVKAALAIQNLAPKFPLTFCIGIHYGKVLKQKGVDITGNNVNTTARVKGLADKKKSEIIITFEAAEKCSFLKSSLEMVGVSHTNLRGLKKPFALYYLRSQPDHNDLGLSFNVRVNAKDFSVEILHTVILGNHNTAIAIDANSPVNEEEVVNHTNQVLDQIILDVADQLHDIESKSENIKVKLSGMLVPIANLFKNNEELSFQATQDSSKSKSVKRIQILPVTSKVKDKIESLHKLAMRNRIVISDNFLDNLGDSKNNYTIVGGGTAAFHSLSSHSNVPSIPCAILKPYSDPIANKQLVMFSHQGKKSEVNQYNRRILVGPGQHCHLVVDTALACHNEFFRITTDERPDAIGFVITVKSPEVSVQHTSFSISKCSAEQLILGKKYSLASSGNILLKCSYCFLSEQCGSSGEFSFNYLIG